MNIIEQAENIINAPKVKLVDYEGEYLAHINANANFIIKQEYAFGEPKECKLFVGRALIETYDKNVISGAQRALNMQDSIMKGVLVGAEYIIIERN